MTCQTLTPAQARDAVARGARLIDIRSADEFARVRLPGAENRPLDQLTTVTHDAGLGDVGLIYVLNISNSLGNRKQHG